MLHLAKDILFQLTAETQDPEKHEKLSIAPFLSRRERISLASHDGRCNDYEYIVCRSFIDYVPSNTFELNWPDFDWILSKMKTGKNCKL